MLSEWGRGHGVRVGLGFGGDGGGVFAGVGGADGQEQAKAAAALRGAMAGRLLAEIEPAAEGSQGDQGGRALGGGGQSAGAAGRVCAGVLEKGSTRGRRTRSVPAS